jgi:hypothetical protein
VIVRCCRSCRWYKAGPVEGVGVCENAAMAGLFDEPLEVRGKELRCRTGWGEDRWEAVEDDIVLDIRIWAPVSEGTPDDDAPTDTSSTFRWSPRVQVAAVHWDLPIWHDGSASVGLGD